jgi:predicted RNase H-like nuclease (RuvC/YqgF family)
MTKNSRALGAGSFRTRRFKPSFNWMAVGLILFSTIPGSQAAGNGNYQKTTDPSYPQPKSQANAEQYKAELQNLENRQKALQHKTVKDEKNTSGLLKRLEEKRAALEKINNRIQEIDDELADPANQMAGIGLRDRRREDLKLKKERLKEVEDLEKIAQESLDRSEANKSQLRIANEALALHSLTLSTRHEGRLQTTFEKLVKCGEAKSTE